MNVKALFIRVILGFLISLVLVLLSSFGLAYFAIDSDLNLVIYISITVASLIGMNFMSLIMQKELPSHPLLFVNTNFFIFLTVFVILSLVTLTNFGLALSMTLGFVLLSLLQNMKTNLLTAKLVSGVFIMLTYATLSSNLEFFLQSFVVLAMINLFLAIFGTHITTE